MLRKVLLILALCFSCYPAYAQTPVRATRQVVKSQTGTTYPVISSDAGKLLTFSNASPVAVSIPQATGSFGIDWFVDVKNLGAGNVTITPATSTIGGLAALVLITGQSARIISNGTNYLVSNTGIGIPTASDLPSGIDAAKIADGSVTNAEFQRLDATSSIQTQLDAKQTSNPDLYALAALSPSNDDIIQRKAGNWTNRTMAQLKTDLALVKGDVGLGNVDNTSDANKPVSTAQQTALDLKENTANKSTGTSLGTSNTLFPTQNAVKVYADTALALKANLASPAFTGTPTIGVGGTSSALTDLTINPTTKASGNLFAAQVNSVNKFSVAFDGSVTSAAGAGISAFGSLFSNNSGSNTAYLASTGVFLPSNAGLKFSSGSDGSSGVDTVLVRDAANVFAQRNGTTAQSFRIYNTFTDASNYERLELNWTANKAIIETARAGTGTARGLMIRSLSGILEFSDSNTTITYSSTDFYNSSNNGVNLGRSSFRWKTGYFGTGIDLSGGTSSALTDLLINPTTKASGSLIAAQVNSVNQFLVSSGGNAGAGGFSVTGSGFEGYTSSTTAFASTRFGGAGGVNGRALLVSANFGGGASGLIMSSDSQLTWTNTAVGSGTDAANANNRDTTLSRNAAGVLQIGTTAANASGHLALTSGLLQPLTVTTLPTGVAGRYAYVTDGDAGLAWGATVVNSGAGATKYLVWYNGTNWTVAGK